MQYPALYINLCENMHGKKILRADIKLLNLVRFGVSSDTTHVEKLCNILTTEGLKV
jgi:hypothetical protein